MTIFHATFIATENVKKFGNEISFNSLINELVILEEGILIHTKIVKFVLTAVLGDNLAINGVLGFSKSFSATKFCRVCRRSKEQTKHDLIEQDIRTKENYESDILEGIISGVSEECIFNRLDHYHVLDNSCFDIMHDLLEGVCKLYVTKILSSLIEEKVLSLDVINNRKNRFPYGELEVGNISINITKKHLINCNLKMTATEVYCFISFLPLMLGDLIPINNKYWSILIYLVNILDLLSKPELGENDVKRLEQLVNNHHTVYFSVYGCLKPKHHFMLHYPRAIKMLGPLRYNWCMRFEAKHKESKIYFQNVTSRLNCTKTIALKASYKFTSILQKYSVGLPNLFSIDAHFYIDNLKEKDFFKYVITENTQINFENVCVSEYILYGNLKYKKDIYLGILNDNFELFKIVLILHWNDNIYILSKSIQIKQFDEHYCSYEVGPALNQITIIDIREFTTRPMHLHSIIGGRTFVRYNSI